MKRRLPSLSALRAFEAAARHLSFRAAAEELSVTHSAISHQVKALEAQLGVMLFRRGPQSVNLTEAGQIYLPVLRDAFDRIAEGTDLIRALETPRELTVQVYVTVAINWLIPRLHSFQQRYPEIQVRISTARHSWSFDPEGADVGIVLSEPREPGVQWTKLCDCKIFPVCSASLLESLGRPPEPADVLNHTLLRVYTAADHWGVWFNQNGLELPKENPQLSFDSYILAYEAAMDRQGIAMVVSPLGAPDLDGQKLARFTDSEAVLPQAWHMVCRPERADRPAVRAFRTWLKEQAS